MFDASLIDQITERVERLLMRHDELIRINTILREQVATLTHERDSLKSRLSAARARVNVLIDRLPANQNYADPYDVPHGKEGTP